MSLLPNKFLVLFSHCLLALAVVVPFARAGDDWLPITPEELKMTSEPKAPGAPAIYLYRQVDRDDVHSREYNYARIKILTEEGRKYADIEIPFRKGVVNIWNIQARTIHPDGSIVNFDGKTYDKMIVKAKGVQFEAKTFTMPDVQIGSIIEYRYLLVLPEGYVYDSSWLLSEELFTKYAKFTMRPSAEFSLKTTWPRGLPPETQPPVDDHHIIHLETNNVEAFQIEDYMPPQDDMKYRVEFMYSRAQETDADKFWNEVAKGSYHRAEMFTDKRKAMEQAVSEIIAASDTPEQKLQKIYARCQKVRNTSFEREKTQQESNREKLKEIQNVEDVWKRGYGNGWDITWLFLALARAAGFDASPVLVSTRDTHIIFNRKLMNGDTLNTNVVLVKLNGKDLYLDPGIAFAPFGMLPWYETGVTGLLVSKDGGTWITTNLPESSDSGVERKATMQLDDSGTLEGKVTATFKGMSALSWRIDENQNDETQRRQDLEDEIKTSIPVAAEVELINTPDWNSSSSTFIAEYKLKVPGWASAAGRRTILAAELFGGGEKHVFESSNRIHPIYFHYRFSDMDDVTINLPEGSKITNLPQPQHYDQKVCIYNLTTENENGSLRVKRSMTVNLTLLDSKFYGALRNYYQIVRNGDDQQVVLSTN